VAEATPCPDSFSSPVPPLARASGGFHLGQGAPQMARELKLVENTKIQEAFMSVPDSETVILVTRNGMGEAELALQHKLITTYFKLLDENNILPAVICFYADGVRLVVDGSPVLEPLASLEAKGVRLVLCSTCLGYFGLTDQVRVGIVGGMTDIIEAQRRASKVISI
jgi:intracellular sulfur oxidation DsrE/DsrF family protein